MIDSMSGPSEAGARPTWTMLLTIVGFAMLTVYCTYVSIHTIDVGTGAVAAEESLRQYHDALSGTRAFPYQWRLLGVYLVYIPERLTGFDPHAIDVVVKTLLLAASSILLFLFSRLTVSDTSALGIVGFYQLLTVAGFTDQYAIYYTSDFAMLACWFGAVYLVKTGRHWEAVALTFVGAWAKETLLLVPVLLALQYRRGRATLAVVAVAALAFAVPSAVLRAIYRAPVTKWAWWYMVFANVPFLQSSLHEFTLTIKNNLKVALFFNVLWVVAIRSMWRARDAFAVDLGITSIVYLLMAYPVIYIRELRHFLPLAIVILPVAFAEFERHGLGPRRLSSPASTATAMSANTNG